MLLVLQSYSVLPNVKHLIWVCEAGC